MSLIVFTYVCVGPYIPPLPLHITSSVHCAPFFRTCVLCYKHVRKCATGEQVRKKCALLGLIREFDTTQATSFQPRGLTDYYFSWRNSSNGDPCSYGLLLPGKCGRSTIYHFRRATLCNVVQRRATPCNAVQRRATPCDAVQRRATPGPDAVQRRATPGAVQCRAMPWAIGVGHRRGP